MSALYGIAGDLLKQIIHGKQSVKTLLYNREKNKIEASGVCLKSLLAIISGVLKLRKELEQACESTGIFKKCSPSSRFIILVMVFELCIGKKKSVQGGGKLKRLLCSHKDKLDGVLSHVKLNAIPEALRFARVNTLLISLEEAERVLVDSGFLEMDFNAVSHAAHSNLVFCKDEHVENVLVFPAGCDLHDHPLVIQHQLILQDKASCFPAFVLNPGADWQVLDACAAPGNKTSHLAALVPQGSVIAVEKDQKRAEILQQRLSSFCPDTTRWSIERCDFLTLDPLDQKFGRVRAILVDPTCSGSGLDSVRLERNMFEESITKQKLVKLAEFQEKVVLHAMRFPNVERITYSTCSVHSKENEQVVMSILSKCPEFALETACPSWTRRGRFGLDKCIRMDPALDRSNGFFVALFKRKKQDNLLDPVLATSAAVESEPAVLQPSRKKRKRVKKHSTSMRIQKRF